MQSGFTYKTSKGSVAGVPDMYESCVAEISEHGQCYLMTAEYVTGPTAESQWLHFLPLRANGTHLLLYIYNTHADLFAVYTTKKNGVHVRPSLRLSPAFLPPILTLLSKIPPFARLTLLTIRLKSRLQMCLSSQPRRASLRTPTSAANWQNTCVGINGMNRDA